MGKRVGAGEEREKLTLPRLEAGSMMTGLAHLTETFLNPNYSGLKMRIKLALALFHV